MKKIDTFGWPKPGIVPESDKERWIRVLVADLEKIPMTPDSDGYWCSPEVSTLSGDTLLTVCLKRLDRATPTYVEVREFLPRGGYSLKYPLED